MKIDFRSLGIAVLCICCWSLATAQKRAQKLAEPIWSKTDRHKSVVETPDKWKDASAVVIYQEFIYDYDQKRSAFELTQLVRQRIKLQDQSAVDEYSELTFGMDALVALRVYKPDGSVRTVDASAAVEATGDVVNIRKLPVEDLVPGDILDYYYVSESVAVPAEDGFDPIITVLSGDYPILEQRLVFLADNRFHFKFRSLNGAPEIQPLTSSDREIAYELIDRDREPSEGARWSYQYREEPTLKFKMLYLNDKTGETTGMTEMYRGGRMSDEMSKRDIVKVCENYVGQVSTLELLDQALEDTVFTGPEDKLNYIYGYLRKKMITDELRNLRLMDGTRLPNISQFGFIRIDFPFVNTMNAYLRKMDLKHHLVIGMPSTLGSISDLLMMDEVIALLGVELEDTTLYFSRPALHTTPGAIPYLIEGTETFIVKLDEFGAPVYASLGELPKTDYQQNRTMRKFGVELNPDMQTVAVAVESRITGHNREDYQDAFLQLFDVWEEDAEMYRLAEERGGKKKKEEPDPDEVAKVNKYKREDSKLQSEILEAWLEDDMGFDIASYDRGVVRSNGRYPGKDTLVLDEAFTTTSLVSRAGKNYLLDVGKIIATQVEITDDEFKRTGDVYMPFARSFHNTISLKIPEGYEVSGLDKLVYDRQHSSGGFVSSATQAGQEITIETEKYYVSQFEPAANWPDIIDFLDAAYDFTQEKILLKPIEKKE